MARGMNAAVSASGQPMAKSTEWSATKVTPVRSVPENSSRAADAVADRGFHSATTPSQAGIVRGSTNTVERNATGQIASWAVVAASGVPAFNPIQTPTHSSPNLSHSSRT